MEKKTNLWVIPTDKPSRLHITSKLMLYPNGLMPKSQGLCKNQNIYITSDEEIKEGDYRYNTLHPNEGVFKVETNDDLEYVLRRKQYKKIILTTDEDLIKDGVQDIDDEFLEWFVKNPSCESVEVYKHKGINFKKMGIPYKIMLLKEEPKFEDSIENSLSIMSIANDMFGKKEEPKQETTLEEFIKKQLSLGKYQDQESAIRHSIELGAKWQQEQICNHNYNLISEQGHRVIKCSKCNHTQPI